MTVESIDEKVDRFFTVVVILLLINIVINLMSIIFITVKIDGEIYLSHHNSDKQNDEKIKYSKI